MQGEPAVRLRTWSMAAVWSCSGLVDDVMAIDELVVGAAREATTTVSHLQGTAHWGWNSS